MQSLMVFLSNHRHLFMFNVLHAAKSTSKSLVCLRNTLALYEHRFTRTSFIKTLNIHTGYSMSKSDEAAYLVSVKDAKNFVERSMVAVGTKKEHARALADVLILADQRGHYSHGLNRLGNFNTYVVIGLVFPFFLHAIWLNVMMHLLLHNQQK